MRISLAALTGWVWLSEALLAAGGLWPSWKFAGRAGLEAAGVAYLTVLPLMLGSGLVTIFAAGKGPAWAAFTFASSGILRMILCVILAVVVLHLAALQPLLVAVWMLAVYLAGLAGEGIWLCRALQRDAHLAALGELEAPSDPSASSLEA
jgi:hypothetical protein